MKRRMWRSYRDLSRITIASFGEWNGWQRQKIRTWLKNTNIRKELYNEYLRRRKEVLGRRTERLEEWQNRKLVVRDGGEWVAPREDFVHRAGKSRA
jgi:hypothetical protein